MKYLSANQLIIKESGTTQPVVARCSDNDYYVLKFRNNPRGSNALVSEVVTARLGHLLGLPIPEFAFVEVPQSLIADSPEITIKEGEVRRTYEAGIQFGSRMACDDSGAMEAIDCIPSPCSVQDLPTFAGIFVLCAWTGANDCCKVVYSRSASSKLLKPNFIDHDRGFQPFFDGGSDWLIPGPPSSAFRDFIRFWRSSEPWVTLVETARYKALEHCVSNFPSSWKVPDELSENLLRYLLTKRLMLRNWIDQIRTGQGHTTTNIGKSQRAGGFLWN